VTDDEPGPGERPRLVLDEVYALVVAQPLRELGHDVVSVAEESTLRAMTDEDVYAWAAEERRRIVTENVRDFRRLLVHAQQSGGPQVALLLTSSRVFPRVRRNPGPLIAALDAWLRSPDARRSDEDWLRPA
jgi:Domain of unknown function (DUF5615)